MFIVAISSIKSYWPVAKLDRVKLDNVELSSSAGAILYVSCMVLEDERENSRWQLRYDFVGTDESIPFGRHFIEFKVSSIDWKPAWFEFYYSPIFFSGRNPASLLLHQWTRTMRFINVMGQLSFVRSLCCEICVHSILFTILFWQMQCLLVLGIPWLLCRKYSAISFSSAITYEPPCVHDIRNTFIFIQISVVKILLCDLFCAHWWVIWWCFEHPKNIKIGSIFLCHGSLSEFDCPMSWSKVESGGSTVAMVTLIRASIRTKLFEEEFPPFQSNRTMISSNESSPSFFLNCTSCFQGDSKGSHVLHIALMKLLFRVFFEDCICFSILWLLPLLLEVIMI